MKKHFVTFLSPGTLFSEETTKPIDRWDVEAAKAMADGIKERHGAIPYGFRFTTRGRENDELDSKVVATSPMYYLGGDVLTLAEVKARNDREDRILIGNMERNGYDRVIVNNNSWKITQPLHKDDIVLT